MVHFLKRFIKFGVVGGFGTVVDFGITALLMYFFQMGEYYSMSFEEIMSEGLDNVVFVVLFVNAIGFIVAATCNYYLNRIWTWRSKNPNVGGEYTRFLMVSIIGLIINIGAIYLCNRYLNWSFYWGELYIAAFWVSKTIATLVVMFWNFFANNYFTFKKYADTATLDDMYDDDAEEDDDDNNQPNTQKQTQLS